MILEGETEVRGEIPPFPGFCMKPCKWSPFSYRIFQSQQKALGRQDCVEGKEEVAPPTSYNKATQQATPTPQLSLYSHSHNYCTVQACKFLLA